MDAPLVYYFGGITPSDNPALYRHLVERLAHVLNLRAQGDARVGAGCCTIADAGGGRERESAGQLTWRSGAASG